MALISKREKSPSVKVVFVFGLFTFTKGKVIVVHSNSWFCCMHLDFKISNINKNNIYRYIYIS